MEKQNKVRITCTNCLYSKIQKRIEGDPKHTRLIVTESCPECNAESNGMIYYYGSDGQLLDTMEGAAFEPSMPADPR